MNNTTSRQKFFIVAAIIFVAIIGISFFAGKGKNDVDIKPEEGSAIDFSDQARIINGTEIYALLDGFTRFEAFARDVRVFGKSQYKAYKSEPQVVGFTITSKIENKNGELILSGLYGSSKNLINITLKKLANERLQTSITDSRTKKNVNEKLPSNSIRNQFIATLPITKPDYTIEYVLGSDVIAINNYADSAASLAEAKKIVMEGLKITALTSKDATIITPITSRGGVSFD